MTNSARKTDGIAATRAKATIATPRQRALKNIDRLKIAALQTVHDSQRRRMFVTITLRAHSRERAKRWRQHDEQDQMKTSKFRAAAAILAGVLLAPAPLFAAENLIPNPGMEDAA